MLIKYWILNIYVLYYSSFKVTARTSLGQQIPKKKSFLNTTLCVYECTAVVVLYYKDIPEYT